jgi:hypothetical protein
VSTDAQYVRPPVSPEAVAEAHPCPIAWCGTLVSPGHVSCRFHWRRIPQGLRDPLIAAFRRRESDPIAHARACDEARRLVVEYGLAPMQREECLQQTLVDDWSL